MIATASLPHKMATLQGLIHALRMGKHPRNIHYRMMPKDTAILTGNG
jgi:hypothetical protein